MTASLFISQFLPPPRANYQTGGTISNRNLLCCLARSHEVTALALDPSAGPEEFTKEPYQVVQKIPPPWRAPGLFLHWQAFVRAATEKTIAIGGTPNFLIATTSTLAAFDVAPRQTKCIAIVQAFENFGFRCPWVPQRTRIDLMKGAVLRRFQDGRLMRRADGILTNSAFMRDAIADRFKMHPDRIHVLKQQIDFEPACNEPPKVDVGFVHRGADKNIALVLELARKAPDLSFFIYGHTEGFPSDPPLNVSMMGWTPDRSAMFASARLWLVPSLWAEPFGRVSIEAQASNRPVLVANRGGLPETVFDERYVIDGYAPEDWLVRIRQLLSVAETSIFSASKRIHAAFSREAHDQAIMDAFKIISESQRTAS